MRLPLQLISLGSALAVMWIAFAHRITVPASAVTVDSMVVPLAVLCGCAVGYVWSYRAALREALQRAVDGTPNRTDERAAQITVGVLVVVGFLLRIARTVATERVVVKRHPHHAPLADAPSHTVPSGRVRFDVYLTA